MEPGQVDSRLGHQSSQSSDEIQRFQDDIRGPVSIRCFECIADISLIGECHAFRGDGRSGNISTQPLQFTSLVCLGRNPGMQRKTVCLAELPRPRPGGEPMSHLRVALVTEEYVSARGTEADWGGTFGAWQRLRIGIRDFHRSKGLFRGPSHKG